MSSPSQEAAGEIEGVAPRDDLRLFAGVGGGDGDIPDAGRTGGGDERHFGFKLEMVPGGKPGAEPGTADKAVTALAVGDAATMKKRGHEAIGPAAKDRHARGIGEAVADDEVGMGAQAPKAGEIGGVMLAITVEEEDPLDGRGQSIQRMMQRSSLAVMRAGKRKDFRASLRGERGSVVAAGIVDDPDGKACMAATAHNLPDGVRLVAGGDENEGGCLRVGRSAGAIRQPRACRRD